MDNPESYASLATRHRTTGKKTTTKNPATQTPPNKA